MTGISEARGQIDIKLHNLKLVYRLIREKGSISRADIARETGMSATSMTRIINQLTDCRLICESEERPKTSAGRRAVLLNLRCDTNFCLCLDIDVDYCKVAIINLSGSILSYRELPILASMSFEEIIDTVALIVEPLAKEAGILSKSIAIVGISCVGNIDPYKGTILYSPQFHWSNVDAVDYVREKLHIPAFIENECKSALIGEINKRADNNQSNIAYITFGERGVGSAVWLKGKLLRGATNAAGELGHTTVDLDGELCDCGHRGCLQTYLAEHFIVMRAQREVASCTTMRDVMDAYERRCPEITELMDKVRKYMAIAINHLSCAYNPDVIILNGSFIRKYPEFVIRALLDLNEYMFRPMQYSVKIEYSQLAGNASLFGIGEVACDKVFDSLLNENI
jgi:predicted NBD/HSP70 family sugar kinase